MAASPSIRRDLKVVRRLINQADLVLATIPEPHPSISSARESLTAALGAKGGTKTAERGPEYFASIAAMMSFG